VLFAGPEFLLSPVYFVHLTSVVRSHCQLGNLSSTPPWLPPVTSLSLSNLQRWPRGTLEPLPYGCAHLCCSYWTPSACINALTFSNSPSPTCPERQRLGTAALRSTAPGPAPAAWPRASSPRQESLQSEPRTAAVAEQIGDGRGEAVISSSMLSHFSTTCSTCHYFPGPGRRRQRLPCY
jgi:hypothetical protein